MADFNLVATVSQAQDWQSHPGVAITLQGPDSLSTGSKLKQQPSSGLLSSSLFLSGKRRRTAAVTQPGREAAARGEQRRTRLLPELVLVYFHDLALQFEGLFGKQLEVSDVV